MTKENRKMLLFGEINKDASEKVIESILKINQEDDKKEVELKEHKRDPIELYINSPGGYVYDGLGIIDCIEKSKTPIHTYCYGKAMSMGFKIFITGHKRYSGKRSTFMFHDVSAGTYGRVEEMKNDIQEYERLRDICVDIVQEKTKIQKSKLKDMIIKHKNWFIAAEEAKELGIVDEIL